MKLARLDFQTHKGAVINPPVASPDDSPNDVQVFQIYVVGGAPNSVRALASLRALCRQHFPESHRIEVIDVLEEPLRVLEAGILVTPTVVRISPVPVQRISGDLSEKEKVLRALGLPQQEEG